LKRGGGGKKKRKKFSISATRPLRRDDEAGVKLPERGVTTREPRLEEHSPFSSPCRPLRRQSTRASAFAMDMPWRASVQSRIIIAVRNVLNVQGCYWSALIRRQPRGLREVRGFSPATAQKQNTPPVVKQHLFSLNDVLGVRPVVLAGDHAQTLELA
jgi:hypothetical protein